MAALESLNQVKPSYSAASPHPYIYLQQMSIYYCILFPSAPLHRFFCLYCTLFFLLLQNSCMPETDKQLDKKCLYRNLEKQSHPPK